MKKILCLLTFSILIVGDCISIRIDRITNDDDNYSNRYVLTQGGEPIREHEFPSFVKVHRFNGEDDWLKGRKPVEECGGAIINNWQILVPASFAKRGGNFVINPYLINTRNNIRFTAKRKCTSSKYKEFYAGEPIQDNVGNTPTIYDVAVLNLDDELDLSKPEVTRYKGACLGNESLKIGDEVTIVAVGKDYLERPVPATKLDAKVIACPDLLSKESVFCMEAFYVCHSDKGAIVVKRDGCIYGLVTYSYSCNPNTNRVAVRAMDLIRLQQELANVTRECHRYARPLGVTCQGDLNDIWGKYFEDSVN